MKCRPSHKPPCIHRRLISSFPEWPLWPCPLRSRSTLLIDLSDSHEHTAAGIPPTSPTIRTGQKSSDPPDMNLTTKTEVSAAVTAVPITRNGFAESAQSTQANSKAGIIPIAYASTSQSRICLNPSGAVNTTNARGGKSAPKMRNRFMPCWSILGGFSFNRPAFLGSYSQSASAENTAICEFVETTPIDTNCCSA